MRRSLAVLAGAVLLVCTAFQGVSSAAAARSATATTPTFTHDVAPILFKHCVTCHRPGQIAPMSLLSYAETRPWARAIRKKVLSHEMPPWPAAPGTLKFRNDRSLTQDDIDTLVAWVDGGVPQGDPKDLPPLPTFADTWVYGKPDYIIEEPVEFQIPADGEIPIQTFYSKLPFKEDRYIEKIEMKPSNVAVVHHANIHFEPLTVPKGAQYVDGRFMGADHHELTPEELHGGASIFDVKEGQLISYTPGRGYEAYWPGTGKVLPAGQWLVWNIHYTPTGKPEHDKTRIGLYFAKRPVRKTVITSQLTAWQTGTSTIQGTLIVEGKELVPGPVANGAGFASPSAIVPPIPPYAENWRISAILPIQEDITLYAFQPHCHLRCKNWQYFVTYPDGRRELLLSVPHYNFEWQLNYELAEPKKIPAGSRLMAIATYDNSVKNRDNPGPDKKVYWATQSWDEMFQPKVEYSIDSYDRKPSTQQH